MTTVDMDQNFVQQWTRLVLWAQRQKEILAEGAASLLYRPEINAAEWNDLNQTAKWFRREAINQQMIDAVKSGKSTSADRVIPMLQIELLSILERAFRHRYQSNFIQAVAAASWKSQRAEKALHGSVIGWLSDEIRAAKR